MRKYVLPLLCGTALLLDAPAVIAQATSGEAVPAVAQATQELETVTVTARRRAESLQRVPVAVSVISKSALENNDATDLSKIAELVPQVMIGEHSNGTGAILTIRGISSSASDAGLDQSVLTVVDGVPLSRGHVVMSSIFDVKQVEIMEGPQALFFGKNSPAGVIALHSADPTDYFEGYVKAGYEFNADERYMEGAVSGPIADHLDARLAVRADYQNGWMRNVAQPIADPFFPGVTDPGAIAGHSQPRGYDLAGRLSLLWTPTEDFDAKFKLTMDMKTENGGASTTEPYCTAPIVPVELGAVPMPTADCEKNQVRSVSGLAAPFAINYPYGNGGKPYLKSRFALASLTLDKRFKDISLTSTTGYYAQIHSDADTYDWGPFGQIYDSEHEHFSQITEELRLNTEFSFPVNFMGGVYFEHSDRPWFNAPNLFNNFGAINSVANNYTTSELQTDEKSQSYSFFGQVRWDIIPTVELAFGARYTHDSKHLWLENIANNPGAPGVGVDLYPQGQPLTSHYSGDNLSPAVTLTWHPTPNQTLYVGYKTGYKAGGISNSSILLATDTSESLKFGDEKTDGVEGGYKADLLDHTLRVDLTAYRYNYNGLQVVSYDAQTISFRINNAAAARTQGVEASFEWLAMDRLTFTGSFGYNDAHYLSFPDAQCNAVQIAANECPTGVQNLSGKALNRAPKVAFDLGADYKAEFLPGWTTDMSMDGAYTSSYQTAADYDPGGVQPAFWRLNAAVHFIPDQGNYEFSIIGRDLTNSYYMLDSIGWSGSLNPLQRIGTFNRPREVVLEAKYRF